MCRGQRAMGLMSSQQQIIGRRGINCARFGYDVIRRRFITQRSEKNYDLNLRFFAKRTWANRPLITVKLRDYLGGLCLEYWSAVRFFRSDFKQLLQQMTIIATIATATITQTTAATITKSSYGRICSSLRKRASSRSIKYCKCWSLLIVFRNSSVLLMISSTGPTTLRDTSPW